MECVTIPERVPGPQDQLADRHPNLLIQISVLPLRLPLMSRDQWSATPGADCTGRVILLDDQIRMAGLAPGHSLQDQTVNEAGCAAERAVSLRVVAAQFVVDVGLDDLFQAFVALEAQLLRTRRGEGGGQPATILCTKGSACHWTRSTTFFEVTRFRAAIISAWV